jgi:hypothetical protein
MFPGHLSVALAAKKAAPEASLGTLVFGRLSCYSVGNRCGSYPELPELRARIYLLSAFAQPRSGIARGCGDWADRHQTSA